MFNIFKCLFFKNRKKKVASVSFSLYCLCCYILTIKGGDNEKEYVRGLTRVDQGHWSMALKLTDPKYVFLEETWLKL